LPGRTKKELQDIAYGIVPEKEWQTYQSLAKNIALDAYSYSFETHVFYDARDTEDRRQMLNLYSDGINPLNVIAITNISNRPPLYTDIAKKAHAVIKDGFIPFIGHWSAFRGFYTDLSIAVNHGVFDTEALAMIKKHKQICAARLSLDAMSYFPPAF